MYVCLLLWALAGSPSAQFQIRSTALLDDLIIATICILVQMLIQKLISAKVKSGDLWAIGLTTILFTLALAGASLSAYPRIPVEHQHSFVENVVRMTTLYSAIIATSLVIANLTYMRVLQLRGTE